jgi:hypothetical protein
MRYTIVLLTALFASTASGGTVEGTISYLYQRASDNLIYVHVGGTVSGRPSCATSSTYFMVRDENSNTGKGQFATLLAAKIAGKTIRVQGSNTCLRWADGEDIDFILILD